jgi:hypothetical protein
VLLSWKLKRGIFHCDVKVVALTFLLCVYARDVAEVMPPIFFSENVIEVTLKFARIIHTSFGINEAVFPQSLCYLHDTFATVEKDAVYQYYKILCLDFRAHHENF